MTKKFTGIGSHPNSRANLAKGNGALARDPIGNQLKGAEVKRRRTILRRAALEAMENGFIKVTSKDIELFNADGNRINVEIDHARLKVPNYLVIISTIIKQAANGNMKAVEILNEYDQNYKNREIKLKTKEVLNQESLLDHMKNVAFVKPVEIGDVTEYEETKREIE